MNKTIYEVITSESYNAICDYCGRIIATECHSFNEVVKKSPAGTNFNGDGHYKCKFCSNYKGE